MDTEEENEGKEKYRKENLSSTNKFLIYLSFYSYSNSEFKKAKKKSTGQILTMYTLKVFNSTHY